MKKILAIFLTLAMLAISTVSYAELTVTGPNIENHKDWLDQMQADNLVGNIINGNTAFVADSVRAWVEDEIVELSAPVRYDSDKKEFYIPASDANAIFGLNESGAEVSSSKISARTSLSCFIDPRGFVLFGSPDAVDTSVPTNYSSYKDYSSVADAMSYIDWQDVEFTDDEYTAYIQRWRQALTYPDGKEDTYKDFINQSIKSARTEATKIVKNSQKQQVYTGDYAKEERSYYVYDFDGIKLEGYDLSGSGLATFKTNLKSAYKQLRTMAIGYQCMPDKKSSEAIEWRDKILGALDYLFYGCYAQGWNYNTDSKQSWVTTQFELPIICSNVLCLMYDEIDPEKIKEYTGQIFDKSPIPDVRTAGYQNNQETYTNRLWRCFSYFHVAVIARDTYRMNYAMKYASSAFLYSARNTGFDGLQFGKDGFYYDGSMIFHNKTPNNMAYGMSYSILIYEFQELTKDTKFDIRKIYGFENVYDFCINNFLPFLTNGQTMRMVHGRAMPAADTSMLRTCAYIALNAPDTQKRAIVAKINEILDGRTMPVGSMQYVINIPTLTEMFAKFNDYAQSVGQTLSDTNSSTVYYNQDEVIHKRENFTAALQMSSSRIAKYESIPPTNENGWYIGDGMLYVYTDGKQYGSSYFNTVDPYYMPGTTVDSTPRKSIGTDAETAKGTWGLPDNDWAGGVSDGENTAAGYIMGNKYVSGLQGRKSYFMIGDKIVCIGTGITGGSGDVYTVVENRIIDKPAESIKAPDIGYEVQSIECSDSEKNDDVLLSMDGSVSTSFTMGKVGDYVTYDFGEKVNIGKIGMAFFYGNVRSELAQIQVSDDGENFTPVKEFESTGETTDIEFYDVNCSGRYLRIVSKGNSKSAWFNLAEIIFYRDSVSEEEIEASKLLITDGFDNLVVDGEASEPVFNETHSEINPGWVWLEEQEGFVFYKDAVLNVMRERNPSSPVYMRMVIDHGEKPSNAEYAYVELPKASMEETKAFSENPDIEILEMSNDVHAVYDKTQNVIYANVFKKDITLEGIKFNTPCSVMINKNLSKLYISDPTWKSNRLSFVIPEDWSAFGNGNVSIKNNTVTIDSSIRRGDVHTLSLRTGKESENSQISVMDYNLKVTDNHFVSTVLYAGSKNGGITFEIMQPPVYGRAAIDGDVLYYAPSGMNIEDKLIIQAQDSAGNTAQFNVTVNKD